MIYERDNIPYAAMLQSAITGLRQGLSDNSARRNKIGEYANQLIGVGGQAVNHYLRSKELSSDTSDISAKIAELENELRDLTVKEMQLSRPNQAAINNTETNYGV
jgi:predicted transcriptional regulator